MKDIIPQIYKSKLNFYQEKNKLNYSLVNG